jgi:hypothetical protein
MSKTVQHSFLGMFACLVLFAVGCTENVESTRFPNEPAIRLIELSDTTLTEFTDTLFVRFRYEDGDGDLGGFDSQSKLFVLDQRLSEPDEFALEELTPNGEALTITGEVNLALGPFFKLGNAPQEIFSVEFWILDRAGNESNHITIEELTIL